MKVASVAWLSANSDANSRNWVKRVDEKRIYHLKNNFKVFDIKIAIEKCKELNFNLNDEIVCYLKWKSITLVQMPKGILVVDYWISTVFKATRTKGGTFG